MSNILKIAIILIKLVTQTALKAWTRGKESKKLLDQRESLYQIQ